MKKIIYLCFTALTILTMISCQSKILHKTVMDNTLTTKEKNEGWKLLFDGQTMNGWRPYLHNTTATWVVEDGTLKGLGKGSDSTGYIISEDQFENFELKLEWKIAPRGNSGILYMVVEDPAYKTPYETGPEYQVIDDLGWPDPLEEWQKTGANYAMHVAQNKELKPVGEWNTAVILVNNGHVEHWLNGIKVVEYELWTDEWKELVAKGKWKDSPAYGQAKKGHLVLQDHGSNVWYKNIKLREL
jgi:hypothetical protein